MLVRANISDLLLEDALPMINAVVFDNMKQWPPIGPSLFQQINSKRALEQFTQISGMGQLTEVAEGASVRYDQPVQGFDKTFRPVQWGLGFKTTHVMAADEKWGIVADMSRQLGRSRIDTRETNAASIWNNAFTGGAYAGPDGQPLCAAAHPLVKNGGTQRNVSAVSADLDVASLQLALTGFRQTRWHAGKRVRIQPEKLITASEGEWNAIETLNIGQVLRGDTANHTTNAFNHRIGLRSGLQAIVWEFLTDPDAWFLQAAPADTGLIWVEREEFGLVHDIDFDSRSMKTAGWERYDYGFRDWIGVWGNPGA